MTLEGTGFYIRGLRESKIGKPKKLAKKLHDHGVSFVTIMAVWQQFKKDGRFQHLTSNFRNDKLFRYADAIANVGIKVGIWGYPWGGAEDQFLDTFNSILNLDTNASISRVWVDPELGFKWANARSGSPPTMRGQQEAIRGISPSGTRAQRREQANRLMDGIAQMVEDHPHMGQPVVTSYGIANYHKKFPWEEMLRIRGRVKPVLSPQLYSATPNMVDRGIEQWVKLSGAKTEVERMFRSVVPSVPTYGKKSGDNLHAYLSSFVDGKENIDGLVFWSLRQTSANEWITVARWGSWLDLGMCSTGGSPDFVKKRLETSR